MIAESLSMHASQTFESVCHQAVRTSSFPIQCSRVGRWWYSGEEIDVVGLDPQTETLLLGECKWTNTPVGTGLLTDLERVAPEVRWGSTDRSLHYALFSRSGFTDDLVTLANERADLHLYTLKKLDEMFG